MADEDVTVQAIRMLFQSPTEMCPLRGWLDILLGDHIDAWTIPVKATIGWGRRDPLLLKCCHHFALEVLGTLRTLRLKW